jgi:hypothetical protein
MRFSVVVIDLAQGIPVGDAKNGSDSWSVPFIGTPARVISFGKVRRPILHILHSLSDPVLTDSKPVLRYVELAELRMLGI